MALICKINLKILYLNVEKILYIMCTITKMGESWDYSFSGHSEGIKQKILI